MTRYVNLTGTGLQLWDALPFYVELFDNWPATVPSEVWTYQVEIYRLPRSRLGGCLEGELQLMTENLGFGRLPAGFQATGDPRQPVRTTLTGLDRLVQVVAPVPGGDEWVIYRGVLGTPIATEPTVWRIPLIGPDALRMQKRAPQGGGMPTPAGLWPLAAASRIYSGSGPISAFGSGWSVPPSELTAKTTFEDWWKRALQGDPMGEYCVGPDLVFAAGTPVGAPNRVTYTVDHRAMNLKSAGRSTTPYLTEIRRWVVGNEAFQPQPTDTVRPAASLPRFAPSRSADVQGQVVTSVESRTETLVTTGGGGFGVSGNSANASSVEVAVPTVPGRMQGVGLTGRISITAVTGKAELFIHAQAHSRVTGAFTTVYDDTKLPIVGNFDITINPDVKTLTDCDYMTLTFGMTGRETTTSTSAFVSGISAAYRYEYTTYSVTYGADPPGMGYPPITDEAHGFSLPGVHAGPYLADIPGSGPQFASTVINSTPDGGIWSDLQCGPLPYATSPVDASGRWMG